jgi:hypothetical protein
MLQAATKQFNVFRRQKRGISTVIVVMLSLALMVTVVGNMVLWSYQMNDLDLQRMQENISLKSVATAKGSTSFEMKNSGPNGVHIVAVWVIDSKTHQRYTVDFFLNPGETATYTEKTISLPKDYTVVKIVTERGNTAVYSPT